MTIARPDVPAGWPTREPSLRCMLQTASWETLPALKESLLELVLGWNPIRTFVVQITDEFILGLDFMHANEASVDLRCHVLRRKYHCVAPGRDRVQPLV
jgi:hypothetical protein